MSFDYLEGAVGDVAVIICFLAAQFSVYRFSDGMAAPGAFLVHLVEV